MKTKVKIALIIILAAALVGAVVLYLINKKQKGCDNCNSLEGIQINSDDTTTVTGSPVASTAPSVSAPTDSLVYTNSTYRFKITLSEVWKGYLVEKVSAPTDPLAEAQFDFVLGGSSQRAVPLSIYVYPIGKVSGGLTGSTEIARSSQYVFGYRTWSSAPSDFQQITEKEIADRLATFQLTN